MTMRPYFGFSFLKYPSSICRAKFYNNHDHYQTKNKTYKVEYPSGIEMQCRKLE